MQALSASHPLKSLQATPSALAQMSLVLTAAQAHPQELTEAMVTQAAQAHQQELTEAVVTRAPSAALVGSGRTSRRRSRSALSFPPQTVSALGGGKGTSPWLTATRHTPSATNAARPSPRSTGSGAGRPRRTTLGGRLGATKKNANESHANNHAISNNAHAHDDSDDDDDGDDKSSNGNIRAWAWGSPGMCPTCSTYWSLGTSTRVASGSQVPQVLTAAQADMALTASRR